MSSQELREKAHKAIEHMPPKALQKLVELLEELQILPSGEHDDEVLIERIINENREVLGRLAQ